MNPSRKIYLTLGALGILVALLVVFIISPLFEEIKKDSADFLLKKGNFASLEAEIKNLEKVKGQYADYRQNLEEIDDLFAGSEVPIDFIRFLEKLANDCEISIKISLSPVVKKENQPWLPLYFKLEVGGSFSSFSRFLEKLENAPYLIEVQSLNIRTLTERERESQKVSADYIDADFLISVFAR